MKRRRIRREEAVIILILLGLLGAFLIAPLLRLLGMSAAGGAGLTLQFYQTVLQDDKFRQALGNSFLISALSGAIAAGMAFLLAYTIHFTKVRSRLKQMIRLLAVFPMIMPTITYGFAIIYSFGKKGLLTSLLGRELFTIYGINGLVFGYVIYTLPVCFLLLDNTMGYIDKKFLVVSRILGDNGWQTFCSTILRPLVGTFAAAFIQAFFLCFTDYGIPASVGGDITVVASYLYNQMLGSVPDFHTGAAVAVIMLLPSLLSIVLLGILERHNIRYQKLSLIEIKRSRIRDIGCGLASVLCLVSVLSVFLVILLIPFVVDWPYRLEFTLANLAGVFHNRELFTVLLNSLKTAGLTAVLGCLAVYGAALITARSEAKRGAKTMLEGLILLSNTVPGMVLGIAYLLIFSGTSLQNTFTIIVACNMIHFFSTPYLMVKNALAKLNLSWETTARLMGDSYMKTIVRIITPNILPTLAEVFSYYFVNGMVTVSAVIFIAGTRTMVLTAKIKELQHFAKFNEIFTLSLMILIINLLAKGICGYISRRRRKE